MDNAKEMLLQQLSDPSARTKVSEKFGGYIRDRLREESFAEQVTPSETVDRSQCQVSVNHDALVKIEYLEPKSRAMVVNFRSSPDAKFIRGHRVEVPFITIMSELFQKPEQEFLAYPFPIAKVIENNAVRDIAEVQDHAAVSHYEAAVQALQAEANGGSVTTLNSGTIGTTVEASVCKGELARTFTGTEDETAFPLQRPDIVRLCNLLDGNRLKSKTILMTETDWNNVLTWTALDAGETLQSETTVNGYNHNTLLGKRIIRTVKTDILRPGNIYGFTDPEYLGRFYILNNTKFYIDKVINIVKFVAWKDIAHSIVNIASVRKLELYSGDATTVNADSVLANVSPVAEDALGAENNRAGDRKYFPNVVQF